MIQIEITVAIFAGLISFVISVVKCSHYLIILQAIIIVVTVAFVQVSATQNFRTIPLKSKGDRNV